MHFPGALTFLLLSTPIFTMARTIPNMLVLPLPDAQETLGYEHPACLMACMNKKPACPANMEAHNLDSCWTCCLRPKTDTVGATLPHGIADEPEKEMRMSYSLD
ncbi:hypothetical protein BDW69DRAFT_176872 [Aspergillus filifer]